MSRNKRLIRLIMDNRDLFWHIPDDDKPKISLELAVEYLLNYGDEKSIKCLFDIVGIDTVADVFNRHTTGPRVNYFPQVVNYFKLYFDRHARRNINR